MGHPEPELLQKFCWTRSGKNGRITPHFQPSAISKYLNRGRYNGTNSPDEMEGQELAREIFAAAGIDLPEREDESKAPKITEELRQDLLALTRAELEPQEKRRVLSLVVRFRSIGAEFAKISAADFRRGHN